MSLGTWLHSPIGNPALSIIHQQPAFLMKMNPRHHGPIHRKRVSVILLESRAAMPSTVGVAAVIELQQVVVADLG